MLLTDEFDLYKNLFINTTMQSVAGLGNLTGSDMAFDLFVKGRYLDQRYNDRGMYGATGTPLSNSIAEMYTLQRYFQYDDMKNRGILHFDAWASTFGQVVAGWELDATGVNYKLNSRFSKFQNVPELVNMYRSFADVILREDLEEQARAQENGSLYLVSQAGSQRTSWWSARRSKRSTWAFKSVATIQPASPICARTEAL